MSSSADPSLQVRSSISSLSVARPVVDSPFRTSHSLSFSASCASAALLCATAWSTASCSVCFFVFARPSSSLAFDASSLFCPRMPCRFSTSARSLSRSDDASASASFAFSRRSITSAIPLRCASICLFSSATSSSSSSGSTVGRLCTMPAFENSCPRCASRSGRSSAFTCCSPIRHGRDRSVFSSGIHRNCFGSPRFVPFTQMCSLPSSRSIRTASPSESENSTASFVFFFSCAMCFIVHMSPVDFPMPSPSLRVSTIALVNATVLMSSISVAARCRIRSRRSSSSRSSAASGSPPRARRGRAAGDPASPPPPATEPCRAMPSMLRSPMLPRGLPPAGDPLMLPWREAAGDVLPWRSEEEEPPPAAAPECGVAGGEMPCSGALLRPRKRPSIVAGGGVVSFPAGGRGGGKICQ
eukprot:Rhum_TRINITY_DN3341_c0_g1::Rhum_TRINITY_DN3341_c0_g1_i1::g.10251::m.10251